MPTSAPLVVLLAYDGLCAFEYGCAFEVFGLSRPEAGTGWYRCLIAAAEPGPIRGQAGLTVMADGGLELLDDAFMVVIPGWRGPDAQVPEPLAAALRRVHDRGCRLLAICSGAFVLAAAGLLDGRRATTHWHHVDRLASTYPHVMVERDKLYVDEGSILTSAGSAAGLDLCLHVVRQDFGATVANGVARRLVLAGHREGEQAQIVSRPVPRRSGTRLVPLLDAIKAHLDEEWPLARIAEAAALSVRGLHRHMVETVGVTPAEWLLAVRLDRARELLEETALSVDAVARAVGFGSATTFRRQFRRRFGGPPREDRRRTRGAAGIAEDKAQAA